MNSIKYKSNPIKHYLRWYSNLSGNGQCNELRMNMITQLPNILHILNSELVTAYNVEDNTPIGMAMI